MRPAEHRVRFFERSLVGRTVHTPVVAWSELADVNHSTLHRSHEARTAPFSPRRLDSCRDDDGMEMRPNYLLKGCHVNVQRASTNATMPQIPSTTKGRYMIPVPEATDSAVCIDCARGSSGR